MRQIGFPFLLALPHFIYNTLLAAFKNSPFKTPRFDQSMLNFFGGTVSLLCLSHLSRGKDRAEDSSLVLKV